jgi:type IV pilus assembly protein PilQ
MITSKFYFSLAVFLILTITSVHGEPVDSLKGGIVNDSAKLLTQPDTLFHPDTTRPTRIIDTNIVIPRLDFSNMPLFDALTAMGRAYKLSLYIDSSITGMITIRLDNVSLNDAMLFIMNEHHLTWNRTGGIIKIYRPVPQPPPLPPVNISFRDNLLTADVRDIELLRFISAVIDSTHSNIVLENGLSGRITGKVVDLELEKALAAILSANGFALSKTDGILQVGRVQGNQEGGRLRSLNIRCDSGLVSLEVSNSPLADVIAEISSKCGISVVQTVRPEGSISATLQKISVEEALTTLLLNTPYTFKHTKGAYSIGAREAEAFFETRLIQMNNIMASTIEPLLPVSLTKLVSVKVVKEHNGLLVTGPITAIANLETFLEEVDVPVAQVLFEVLVVDYATTDRAEFSLIANNFGGDTARPGELYYPRLDFNRTGPELNRDLNSISRELGIANLGTLPDNFFVRLRAMVTEGTANVRSQPQIACMNGNSATLRIGTTQYYLLESQTIYPSQQTTITTQKTERFEKIEADMSLEVTPFVNRNGDVIVTVKPEFNSPVGAFDPDVPPTINRRELSSTVRLRNGETIVLGGLVETSKVESIEKVPILGTLPIIGRIFQNRSTTDRKANLMIYITPRVYFGSDGAVNVDSLLKR